MSQHISPPAFRMLAAIAPLIRAYLPSGNAVQAKEDLIQPILIVIRIPGSVERSLARNTPHRQHCMTDDLELLIAALARHQGHRQQCSLAAATRQIRRMVAEAREEYRTAGAPYGDD